MGKKLKFNFFEIEKEHVHTRQHQLVTHMWTLVELCLWNLVVIITNLYWFFFYGCQIL